MKDKNTNIYKLVEAFESMSTYNGRNVNVDTREDNCGYLLQRRFIVNLCSHMDVCYKENIFLLICVVMFEKEQYLT